MCKKHTSVFHSSTESEIISSDAGMRMDGSPALSLWDVEIEVLRSTKSTESPTHGNCSRTHKSNPQTKGKSRCWSIFACGLRRHKRTLFSRWVSVVHLWRQRSSDQNDHWGQKSNDEIRAKNPQSALLIGYSTELILDPKTHIKHVDAKNKIADMLTKGNFTRDEWDHLLHLLYIMNFSMFSCSHFLLSNKKQSAMSKRGQECTSGEGSPMAKPRHMNLVTSKPRQSSRKYWERGRQWRNRGESRVGSELCFIPRQETDAKHQTKPNNVFSREATWWHSIFHHQETGAERWFFKLSPRQETGARWYPIWKVEVTLPQHAHRYFEKVFKNQRTKLNLTGDAPVIGIEALKTNVLIWERFMSTTMKAAIHLGPNCFEFLEVYRNTIFEELQNVAKKLILNHHAEILNVTTIDRTRSTFSHDQVITWTKAKIHVYSDSVLCLGKLSDHSEANRRWENQVNDVQQSSSYRELLGIDGEPIQIEWNISQNLRHWRFSRRSRKTWKSEISNLRIWRSTHLHVNVQWYRMDRGNSEECISNSEKVKNYAKRFPRGHWTFLGPGDEKKWYGTLSNPLEGKWGSIAAQMVVRFKETNHPVFKSISALSRTLKRKNNRDAIHFNADASITELLFRTIHSANQLGICGAVFKLVWRVRSKAEWVRADFGKVRGKRKRAVIEECETARSKSFGANSKDR